MLTVIFTCYVIFTQNDSGYFSKNILQNVMEAQVSQYVYKKIALKPTTFDRLRGFGVYGDTADDIVKRLMDKAAGEVQTSC